MSISVDMARKVMEACKQRARELRSPVSIAIVDAGGHLVLFERMMSPYGWATGDISIAKANTSVMFNQPTDGVAQWGASIPGFASSLSAMTEGKFIMAAGGWPIRVNNITVGGVGVSGGNAPGRDDEIARAGLAGLDAVPLPPGRPAQPVQSQAVPVQAPYAAQSPVQAQYAQPPVQGQRYNNDESTTSSTADGRNAYPVQSQDAPYVQHLSANEGDPYHSFRPNSNPDQFHKDSPGEQK